MRKYLWNKIVIMTIMFFLVLSTISPARTLFEQKKADDLENNIINIDNTNQPLYYIEPGPIRKSILYEDGSVIKIPTEILWQPMSGSTTSDMTLDEFEQLVIQKSNIDRSKRILVSSGSRAGLNIVFNTDGSVPGSAVTALETAATYIEGVFTDDVTVIIDVDFANLGGSVLGQTGVYYTGSPPSWSTTRTGLINDMDADDTIQDWLPTGNTIPVRYDGSSSTVTDENRCYFAWANYGATIGSNPGTDAEMTFNNQVGWDYDPSNGVSGYCFQSVVVHEVGHALGFISAAESWYEPNSDIYAMDIFRFQRTDGGNDYNPDTLAEFQTTARLVDYNNPNDDHNSDLISVEYRMSDGNPYQASHFRQGSVNGIMQPAIGSGTTFYPNFFRDVDINVIDAFGWDYTTVPSYTLTVNIEGNGQVILDPPGGTYLEGTPVQLTAQADPGWLFDHWSGDDIDGSTNNPETITMNSDKTVTANFTAIPYTLTVTIEGSGSVIKNPDQPTYTYGAIVELTAIPDQDWSFENWTGDDIDGSTDNPEFIVIDDNKAVTAHFSMNDIVPPEWQNQGQNQTTIEPGETILLYAQGRDDVNLDWTFLATNETGEWLNFSVADWWNHDWEYHKQITIDHTFVDADLTDFPVLIQHTSMDLASKAQTDGDDFVFVDETHTIQYDHEIEYYDSGTGQLTAWVNIPFLSSTTDTVLYLYYGNPDCGNQENIEDTWNDDYLMIHHMTGTSYTELDDSTQQSWDVTSEGGIPIYNAAGKVGKCVDFNGVGDYLKIAAFSLATDSPYTGSAWVLVDGNPGSRRAIFEGDNDHGIALHIYTDERFMCMAHSSESPPTPSAFSTTTVDVGNPEWYYVTTRADAGNSELKIYVNGVHEGDPDTITGTINAVNGLNIGTWQNNDNYWMNGRIDELRVSNMVRSDSWIQTEYNNMMSPSSFASVGFEIARGGGSNYGSPMNLDGAPDQWVWSNFTWQNASIPEGTTVGWRIYYVDSSNNKIATDIMSFTIGTGFCKADFDEDGDVDLSDYATFSQCFAGAGNPPAPGCTVDADFDDDGDVDLSDYALFSQCFAGAGNPPAPTCTI